MNKFILIIEDNPKNLKLFRDILRANGYRTAEATDGKQGLDLALQRIPDLILLDLMLPVMNGFEVVAAVKADQRTRKIPVIAVSSFAMAADEKKALETGCDGYITKPIDLKKFIIKIEEYLCSQTTAEHEIAEATFL